MIRLKIRNITFELNEETGESTIKKNSEDIPLHTKNPIEAFNTFWQSAGTEMLNEIKNKLSDHGFNRWTGERTTKEREAEICRKQYP